MRTIPIGISSLLKSRSMIGPNAPRCEVAFTSKVTSNTGSAWTQVAAQLNSQTPILSLAVFNGKLYGSTAQNGRLFEWNGVNAWTQVAAQLDSQTYIHAIRVYNNKLYGATRNGGRLFEWNGTDAWSQVAAELNSQTQIYSLCEYNNKLYAGTYPDGKLFRWNGTDAWVEVADSLNSQTQICTLCVFDNALYGGTAPGGKLFRWNGTDAWVEVADKLNSQTQIYGICVYNEKIYGGTYPGGRLFEWNGTDAWTQVAAGLNSQTAIMSLAVFNEQLYGGTFPGGRLFEWNGTDAWTQVAAQAESQTQINSLCVYRNTLYGGTHQTDVGGRLFKWDSTSIVRTVQPSSINLSREEAANAQRCVVEFPNVNPTDPTDAGYYSPYRNGTDFPAKAANDWQNQIIPSKGVQVKAGYGDELSTVFTGSIDLTNLDTVPKSAMVRVDCRDAGWNLVDKTITSTIDGDVEYYIDYPIDLGTTTVWLTSDMFVVMAKGDKMIFTSDQGGPVTLALTAATYTGADLATHLAAVMNADTTLTGSGTITFAVTWSGITRMFTIDAGAGHTIAFTYTGSTACALFGMTADVTAAQSIESVEAYTATIETIVKDLCVRAGFAEADVTIEPTYQLLDPTFERMTYGDAIEQMCTLSGFELVVDEDNKAIFRYPTDRQPEAADEVMVLNGTTPGSLEHYPVVTASILVYSAAGKTGTLYSSTTDYLVTEGTASTAWTIERRAGSTIPDGGTVYVTYVYAAWVFKEGEDIFQLGLNISRSGLYGKIIVEGDGCEAEYATSTPLWDGGDVPSNKVLFVLDENLDTDAKCQAIADRLGADMAAHYIESEWAAVGIPWLQVGDCVQIIESSSTISEIYRIMSMNFSFDPDGMIMAFKAYHYGYAPI